MNAVKEIAYAKINLHLDVIGKRDDGFHDIKTVMHSVSLSDELVVSVAPAREISVRLSIDGNRHLPTDSRNLVYSAAVLFLKRLGVSADVQILLKKRIPVSAGLAGGSSDAAATLRALNRLYKKPFTQKALVAMAAELGSDVPYCVVGKTALCEGRGEKIRRIDTRLSLNLVVASAGEYSSTPEAYRELDDEYCKDGAFNTDGERHLEILMDMLKSGELCSDGFYNLFEKTVLRKCKRSCELKEKLEKLSAVAVMMSGSGPSVFAVFESAEPAEQACRSLIAQGYHAWAAKSV